MISLRHMYVEHKLAIDYQIMKYNYTEEGSDLCSKLFFYTIRNRSWAALLSIVFGRDLMNFLYLGNKIKWWKKCKFMGMEWVIYQKMSHLQKNVSSILKSVCNSRNQFVISNISINCLRSNSNSTRGFCLRCVGVGSRIRDPGSGYQGRGSPMGTASFC